MKLAFETLKAAGAGSFVLRALLALLSTFTFFQVLPHFPGGVPEVNFILGSTLFLISGADPAAFGLAFGLLLQGVLFATSDLPQYFINVTNLLVPLFAVAAIAERIIAPNTAYIELTYAQALKLSTTYQAGVVAWVAFWAFYGQGFGAETIAAVTSFGAIYILLIIIEPIADIAVSAGAKSLVALEKAALV